MVRTVERLKEELKGSVDSAVVITKTGVRGKVEADAWSRVYELITLIRRRLG